MGLFSGRIGVWTALGWLVGTALQLQQAEVAEPLMRVAATGGAALLLAVAWWWWRGPVVAVAGVLMLAAALLAWALTDARAQQRLADRLDPTLEMQPLWVTGVVAGLPVVRPEGVRFELRVESVASVDSTSPGRFSERSGRIPERLSLSWTPAGDTATLSLAAMPRAGQRWRLPVRLRVPDGLVNPHGFDTALAMFERGVGALGTVQASAGAGSGPVRLAETGTERLDRWRQDLRDRVRRALGDTPAAGLLAALSVGDQAAIDREDWAVFRTTGVAHLVAISGLHVTLLGWLAGVAIGGLWRWRAAWLLVCPAPVVARWGGLAAAVGYALLAGWGVPAQRTVLMMAILALQNSGARRWSGGRLLLAAAVGVAAWDPWALLQPGFWLSFVAVALLMLGGQLATPATSARGGWIVAQARALWHTQWVVTLGLAPWTLLFFQQVSLVSLLANAVAIPVVTLLVTPLALLGLLVPPLWGVALPVIEVLMQGLQVMAAWPWASVHLPVVPLWAQGLGIAGAALMVLPLPIGVRLAGAPLLLPMLWPALPLPSEGEFELLAADIGQGNAVLVRTARHSLLYDTGPAYGRHAEAGNAGERVLVPLLWALGVRSLDQMVITHRDTDHSGGAAAVLRALPVVLLQSSLEPGHPLRQGVPHQRCAAGTRWTWDGVDFEILHPEAADHDRPAVAVLRPNAVSCVLRVAARGGRAALLTGDIGLDQELRLVIRQPARLRAEVLLVPHHGSGSSSTSIFLKSVQPTWAIVQAGRHNRYGHPAPAAMARYAEQGIAVVRTSQCGAWHWQSAGESPWCARDQRIRYWHPVASVP